MLETKTYYGEYTLEHWINMLLHQDLVLPEYQRSFQWKPENIQHFIESLKDHQFVPPITIGSYVRNGQRCNFIIDGQQRLTALLLAKLGYYPRPENFHFDEEQVMNDNEDDDEGEDRIEWTFQKIITKKSEISSLRHLCAESNYNTLECDIPEDFFATRYMGFAYIVPKEQDENKHLPYFATVFRNINFQGIALSPEESRLALYYWNTEVTNWFRPPFLNNLLRNSHEQVVNVDFVRYASFLSQYIKKNRVIGEVFRGKRLNREKYYEQYIHCVAEDIDDLTFGKFSTYFPNKDYIQDINRLEQAIRTLGYRDIAFDKIVKLDIYFFGLIYNVVFLHKELNLSEEQIENLKRQLERKIERYPMSHKDNPGTKAYLRTRITDSISVFNQYFHERQ